MTKQRKINILADVIYYVITIAWFVSILMFFWFNYDQREESRRVYEYKQQVLERPATDYFQYFAIIPIKKTFELWEFPKLQSDRMVNEVDGKVHQINWFDILYCDTYDWTGIWRTRYEFERKKPKPDTWIRLTAPREWKSWTPQNPVWTYIPAKCKIQATMTVCPIDWDKKYCKSQTIRSDEFYIGNSSPESQE